MNERIINRVLLFSLCCCVHIECAVSWTYMRLIDDAVIDFFRRSFLSFIKSCSPRSNWADQLVLPNFMGNYFKLDCLSNEFQRLSPFKKNPDLSKYIYIYRILAISVGLFLLSLQIIINKKEFPLDSQDNKNNRTAAINSVESKVWVGKWVGYGLG